MSNEIRLEVALFKQLRSFRNLLFFFVFCFDNQFRNYKPSYVPKVSLTISAVEILQDYYLKANFIKTFLCLVGVTLMFGGSSQIKVQRCQIAAPRWPNDISSVANNAIKKTGHKTSSVASAVCHVAPSCWDQMLPISSS